MPCNWELYEFRVVVFTKGVMAPGRGFAGQGVTFEAVFPDLKFLGIGGFQGANNYCDFKSVFNQLIKLKTLPFSCSQKGNQASHFGRIQAANQKGELLPAAKLYVHRRDQSDLISKTTEIGVLLKEVTVDLAVINNGGYYIYLSGNSASSVNY